MRDKKEILRQLELPKADLKGVQSDRLNVDDIRWIVEILITIPSTSPLKTLVLKDNSIGNEGVKIFAEYFPKFQFQLNSLFLGNNRITTAGIYHLCNIITYPSCSLQTLSVSCNDIGDKGVKLLCYALSHNNSIKSLWLKSCNIGDEGATRIITLLEYYNSTLLDIHLEDDSIFTRFKNTVSDEKLDQIERLKKLKRTNGNIQGNIQAPYLMLKNEDHDLNDEVMNDFLFFIHHKLNSLEQTVVRQNAVIEQLHQTISTQSRTIQELKGSKLEALQIITKNQRIRSDIIKERVNSFSVINPQRLLGIGGEGMVFLCQHTSQKLRTMLETYNLSLFAVKILYNLGDETFKLRQNEFEILNDLQTRVQFHSNILPILHHFIDTPSDHFFEFFTDLLRELGTHPNGSRRSCTAIITPYYHYNLCSFLREYSPQLRRSDSRNALSGSDNKKIRKLTLVDRLVICLQIANALKFLTQNFIIHRDLKLDNILIHVESNNSEGEVRYNSNIDKSDQDVISSAVVIIADFGLAIKVNGNYEVSLRPGHDSLGGNSNHLAPEIKYVDPNTPQFISYKKQPSWEFGLLAYEILFGQYPSHFHPSSTNADTYFSQSHFQAMYYDMYHDSEDFRHISDVEIAGLLQPLLRSNPLARQSIWEAYHTFLSFIQTHYPDHPTSSSFAL